jgi:hypothetical protein
MLITAAVAEEAAFSLLNGTVIAVAALAMNCHTAAAERTV